MLIAHLESKMGAEHRESLHCCISNVSPCLARQKQKQEVTISLSTKVPQRGTTFFSDSEYNRHNICSLTFWGVFLFCFVFKKTFSLWPFPKGHTEKKSHEIVKHSMWHLRRPYSVKLHNG